MNASVTFPALTAEEWIDREIDDLTRLRHRLATTAELDAATAAARFETTAGLCAAGLQQDGMTLQAKTSMLWLAGRYALKAKVYRALQRERGRP